MKKFLIYIPYSSDETVWLQWEKPKDIRIVRWFPGLATRFPHIFRNFVFRVDEERAAEIPENVTHKMLERAKAYFRDAAVRVPAPIKLKEV